MTLPEGFVLEEHPEAARREPASIRNNNPGAMWHVGGWQESYGADFGEKLNDGLGQENQIAMFPDKVSGAAAQIDLLSRYGSVPVKDAVRKWSGGNNVGSYLSVLADAGFAPDDNLSDLMADKDSATRFAAAMAYHEAGKPYPLDERGWGEAFDKFQAVHGRAPAPIPEVDTTLPEGFELEEAGVLPEGFEIETRDAVAPERAPAPPAWKEIEKGEAFKKLSPGQKIEALMSWARDTRKYGEEAGWWQDEKAEKRFQTEARNALQKLQAELPKIEDAGFLGSFAGNFGSNATNMGASVARGATSEGVFMAAEGGYRALGSEIMYADSEKSWEENLAANLDALRTLEETNRRRGFPALDSATHKRLIEQDIQRARMELARIRQPGTAEHLAASPQGREARRQVGEFLESAANEAADYREAAREAFPVSPEYQESLIGQAAQGVGQLALLPAYMVTGLGPALAVSQLYQEGYDDYVNTRKSQGLAVDPREAHEAAKAYAAVAAPMDILTDKLLIGKFFKAAEGKATVGEVTKRILSQAAQGGTSEGGQQLWLNAVAKELSGYDPNRTLTRDVWRSVLVGAAVGGPAALAFEIAGQASRGDEVAAVDAHGVVPENSGENQPVPERNSGRRFREHERDASEPETAAGLPSGFVMEADSRFAPPPDRNPIDSGRVAMATDSGARLSGELTGFPEPNRQDIDDNSSRPLDGPPAERAIAAANATLHGRGYDFQVRSASADTLHPAQRTEAARLAGAVARLFGRRIVMFESLDPSSGSPFNAFDSSSPAARSVIFLHSKAARPHLTTVGHEIYRELEVSAPTLARQLRTELEPLITSRDRMDVNKASYDPGRRYHEVAGDLFGDAMPEERFWAGLKDRNPALFGKVAPVVGGWLTEVIAALRTQGFGSSQYLSDIDRARSTVDEALAEFSGNPSGDARTAPVEPTDANESYPITGTPAGAVARGGSRFAPTGENALSQETGRSMESRDHDLGNPAKRFPEALQAAEDAGKVAGDFSGIAQGMGLRVLRDRSGKTPRVSREDNGEIILRFDPVEVALFEREARDAGTPANLGSRVRFTEELVHGAHLLYQRRKWEEAGKPGKFSDFVDARMKVIFDDIRNTVENAPAGLQADLRSVLHDSYRLYSGSMDKQALMLSGPGSLFNDIRDPVTFVAEFLRQAAQLRRDGRINEQTHADIWDFLDRLAGWVRDALENIRKTISRVSRGDFGPSAQVELAHIERTLAEYEGKVREWKASGTNLGKDFKSRPPDFRNGRGRRPIEEVLAARDDFLTNGHAKRLFAFEPIDENTLPVLKRERLRRLEIALNNMARESGAVPPPNRIHVVRVRRQRKPGDEAKSSAAADRFISDFESLTGAEIVFFDTDEASPSMAGAVRSADPNTIWIHARSRRIIAGVIGHEWGHGLQFSDPDLYRDLQRVVFKYTDNWRKRARDNGRGYKGAKTLGVELTNNTLGDAFLSREFWEGIRKENDSRLFERVYYSILKFIDSLMHKADSAFGTELFSTNLMLMRRELAAVAAEAIRRSPYQK